MKLLVTIATIFFAQLPQWTTQTSGVTARLRGISAVNERVAWASGSGDTVLRTTDGGATWRKLTVASTPTTAADQIAQLDFRDIDAVNERTAYVLSIGNGPASRIYKTTDAGTIWTLQFKNNDPRAFLDSMSFWDADHGMVVGDSIGGQFYILTTENGGHTWRRVPASALPPALDNEGAFAASGSNIAVFGETDAWIGTGAAVKARVLRTTDRGRTWKISETPLIAGPSAGIFSVAFRDAKHGIIVGGDYTKEKEAVDSLALTSDGGITWTLMKGLSGYRSAVAYIPLSEPGAVATGPAAGSHSQTPTLVAVGPSGTDYSTDDGRTWTQLAGPGFDTLSFARSKAIGWAAGAHGIVARFALKPE